MKFSLLVSIIFHILLFLVLFVLVRAVPEMNLPQKIYSVKILRPIVSEKSPPPRVEEKPEEPPEEKPEPEPEPEPEEKKPVPGKKKEAEKEPQEQEKEPLQTSVDSEEGGETELQVDSPEFPFTYYLGAIERNISQNWFSAVSENTALSCVVYFRLNRRGRISSTRIEKSSGNRYFDRAALQAVRSSAPFPPLPAAFDQPYLGIHFTFVQGRQ